MTRILTIILFLSITADASGPPGQHGILWSWTLSTTSGVTSQKLYCGTTTGGENYATPIATLTATDTSYLYQGGIANQRYYCTVTALINTIESAPSGEASAIYPTVAAPPTALTGNPQ